ncbi:interferon alpha-inducible protein 27-like protein 2A [Monodelphis domestica]|uniref:interferon alpha-inducible protein 27-like protein 2A n=1 Tax=Monodelphis domestica TaxID=13616 RepID=UPI0024E2273F|nr:interferon alpha-inducible protein 27-like protein 2A [Monodelphis domestica]
MNKLALITTGAIVGGGVTLASVPVILGAAGFTGTGIVAGSLAAKMMSAAAVANGGGIASGSLVAVLQSVGAGGLSTSVSALVGSAGSTVGSALAFWLIPKEPPAPSDPG